MSLYARSLTRSLCSQTRSYAVDTKSIEYISEGLSPLSKPLGVAEYPTTKKLTRDEKLAALLDQDVRMEERRHLIKEATKSYFHDLNAIRKNGGKTWIAPPVMIREDKALYFPNVTGKALDGTVKDTAVVCAGRVTVLAMLNSRISEYHAKAFVDPTHNRFSSHPSYQYLQINLQENILKAFVVNMFTASLRKTIPPELHGSYLLSSQNMEYVYEAMGMVNNRIGYVYLIDPNMKIRWAACGDALPDEPGALLNCTGVLLNRLDKTMSNTTKI